MSVALVSSSYCDNLYYKSATGTCLSISGATIYQTGTIAPINQDKINAVTIDGTSII